MYIDLINSVLIRVLEYAYDGDGIQMVLEYFTQIPYSNTNIK